MPKRALILKGGTMRGAFLVGALKTIYKELGPNYFDAIYANSVGVFEQAFFASGQIETMEKTWVQYVDGGKLLNFFNPFRGREILDLDYLVNLFQNEKSYLDINAMRNSYAELFTYVTDYETRIPMPVNLKEGPVFDIMRATCALPIIYNKKVFINGRRYVDSYIVKEKDFKKILDEEIKAYDEVWAVSAYPNDQIPDKVKNIIKPSHMPLWGIFDTNQGRIINTIKQGELDAEKFIRDKGIK